MIRKVLDIEPRLVWCSSQLFCVCCPVSLGGTCHVLVGARSEIRHSASEVFPYDYSESRDPSSRRRSSFSYSSGTASYSGRGEAKSADQWNSTWFHA